MPTVGLSTRVLPLAGYPERRIKNFGETITMREADGHGH